jgi:tetratricopeptide (TPR) repeat protein
LSLGRLCSLDGSRTACFFAWEEYHVGYDLGGHLVKIHPRLHQDLVSSQSWEQRDLAKHLASCARCRRHFDAVLGQVPGPLVEKLAKVLVWPSHWKTDYGPAITAAERRCLVHARALAAERADAPARLAELKEQPQERREMLIRNYRRFQNWGLLEQLINHAWEECFVDALAAESFAKLALDLTDLLERNYYGVNRIEDMRARAWAFVGNARRIRFELDRAAGAFDRAFTHLCQGTGDILERALLFELRASLLRAQRRPAEAERLLLRVLRIYREVGETHRAGRVLVSLSVGHEMVCTPERSIPLLYEALELIDVEREPRQLTWTAHHNLITALAETGRFMEAQGLFIQTRPLYARFPDSHTQNRRHWVAGRIARGLGQMREAEAHLQAAQEGFISSGCADDASLVTLELAALYAEQNRAAELKQLAEEALAVFSSQQIHREALAALSFLQQAAMAERVSLELVTRVATFVKRVQGDPSLTFVNPTAG